MKQQEEILRRIAHFLIIQGSFVNNIGLLSGKMGIVIFFYIYSRVTGNKLFGDLGGELIDEIYKQIYMKSPIGLGDGMAGIAWGIKYLIDNKFVFGDIEIVLEDLDSRIQEWDVRKVRDFSLRTGLKGLAYYVIYRYGNMIYGNSIIPYDYINDLIDSLKLNTMDEENQRLVGKMNSIIRLKEIEMPEDLLYRLTRDIDFNQATLFKDGRPLGILDNGLAGIGLNLIWKARS